MLQQSPYQTLKGLKQQTYHLWCDLNEVEAMFGRTWTIISIPSKPPSYAKPPPLDDAASQLPLDLGDLTLVEPVGKPKKGKKLRCIFSRSD